MIMVDSRYESGCDLIRVTAILFVIAGHFFSLYTNFTKIELNSVNFAIQGFLLSIFYISVPLFVLLTGYLNSKKDYNKIDFSIYKPVWKVLSAYLIYAGVSILFMHFFQDRQHSLLEYIRMIFEFNISPYSWYIEFYLCLSLFIPFLNMLMNKLNSNKQQRVFIVACIVGGLAPAFFNRQELHLFPNMFYMASGAFAYYSIGFYIARHKPVVNRFVLIAIIVMGGMFDSLSNYLLHRPFHFIGGEVWSLYYAVIAIAMFLLLYDVKIYSRTLKLLSVFTLDVYLCCWMFDAIYYPLFKEYFYVDDRQFFPYILILVPLIYFSSIVVAIIRKKISKMFFGIIKRSISTKVIG